MADNQDFLKEAYKKREDIINGEATWADMSDLRSYYGQTPLTSDSLRRWFGAFDIYKQAGWISPPVQEKILETEETNIEKDGSISSKKFINISEIDKSDPKALMKAHGFDPNKYILTSAKNSIWGYNKDGSLKCSSKISVKPITAEERGITYKDIENYFSKANYPSVPVVESKNYDPDSKLFLEVPVQDLHMGLYAYGEEAGADYDVYIARARFKKAFLDILERAQGKKFKRIILPLLGDILHVCGDQNTTVHGTPQDTDSRVSKVYNMALDMLIEAVEALKSIAPVEVYSVEGNHDGIILFTLVKSLEMAFRNDPQVTFYDSPSPRKYSRYGNILLGWTHGDMPQKNITEWMQSETAQDWGETMFHHVHAGHLHSIHTIQKIEDEQSGLFVEYLPALCASSAWENQQGFGRNPKMMISFVWDEEKGLRDKWYSII